MVKTGPDRYSCCYGFQHPGPILLCQDKVSLVLLDGSKQSLQFGFAFTQKNGTEVFQAGVQEVEVAELPDKYTLALVLHQEEQIWVTDWINQPLQGFEWTLGKHSFKLT